jgi:transposase
LLPLSTPSKLGRTKLLRAAAHIIEREAAMERVIERGAGLDIHKKTIVACIRVPGAHGERRQEVQTFGTTAAQLLALRDWLSAHGVTHVAMESTGVYWKPVYYVLEEVVTCLLVNPVHVSKVPGRKTDVRDCEWLAQLLEHGLLRGSFVPPLAIRDLRDLTRYRAVLVQDRTREANRLHKVLTDAGIQLASVASNVLGKSGRAMLAALVEGTTDATILADLAQGKLRRKLPALREALVGRFRKHHALLVSQLLAHLDYLDEALAQLTADIEEALGPFASEAARLDAIPGVGRRTAEIVIAELGVDMRQFPTARHVASWAGLCPGTHESAGKRRAVRSGKGNRWLRAALIEAALAAINVRESAFAGRYRRLVRRCGHKKAIVAVAHHLLTTAYRLLADGCTYQEAGAGYYDARLKDRLVRRALQTLAQQGYRVALEPAA